tara:strand:+ start:1649 stop:2275 length:627 start_codon:yes stop_codon:yes gene_type:complete
MGSKNHKIVKNFISEDEVKLIVDWVDSLNPKDGDPNHHLSEISKTLNGKSCIIDISNTELTNYITNFQSVSKVSKDPLPGFIYNIIDRISEKFNFPKDNIFIQAVDMSKGGKINPHYDASIDGYINYKCNVSVLSEDYELFVDKETISVEETDLYGFEASLYKHWTNEFNSRRVFLSFGFILPYEILNRNDSDPRVRLSKRIGKYFQQ